MHWAIYDWQDARKGDKIYMLCEGKEGFEGILFTGAIIKAPVKELSWRGDGSPQYYVDMHCEDCNSITLRPIIPVEDLEAEIPDFNWRKGHSGEELTGEQAAALEVLWAEKIREYSDFYSDFHTYGEDYGEDSLHVYHMDTIDEDFLKVIHELSNSPDNFTEVAVNGDKMVLDCGNAPLYLRMICKEREEGIETKWIFPVFRSNHVTAQMLLTDIREYHHGMEAELTVKYGEAIYTFYDTEYYANKSIYKIGDSYPFSLTGIAYSAQIVPKNQRFIKLAAQEAQECGFQVEPGEKDIIIRSDTVVAFIQLEDSDPCDAQFQSPIQSEVEHLSLFGREFYKLDICIVPESPDGEYPMLTIPILVRKSNFSGRKKKDLPVSGTLWLQGSLVTE